MFEMLLLEYFDILVFDFEEVFRNLGFRGESVVSVL